MNSTKICIIGGGISGVTCAKILKEKGIDLNHSVEHIDGKYSIKLNSNYDLTELDKLTDV